MPAVAAADLAALADALTVATANAEKTSRNLQQHIKDEGLRVGALLGKSHAKAADERIRDSAAELQRQTDLVQELFRQRVTLERHSDRYGQIVRAVRAAKSAGETTVGVEQLLTIINASFETSGVTGPKEN